MATKPVTLPRPWATNAVYATGPFAGSPGKVDPGVGVAAEGHRPGAANPTAAEHENYQQNLVTASWIPWVNSGSSAGAADAHLVETNATGRSQLKGLDVIDATNETAINVTGASTLAPVMFLRNTVSGGAVVSITTTVATAGSLVDVAMIAATSGPGIGVGAVAGVTGKGIQVTHAGSGDGLNVNTSTGTGVATVITGNATATAAAITSGAGQIGLEITATNTSPRALSVTGSNAYCIQAIAGTNGVGAILVGAGTGTGAAMLSGTTGGGGTGHAIEALARNSTGHGILSTSHTTSTAAAGRFVALDAAYGVYASSVSQVAGYFNATARHALRLAGDLTAPVYGTILVDGQDTRPTDVTSGQLTFLSTEGQWGHSEFSDSGWRALWSSPYGYACAYSALNVLNTSAVAGTYATLAVISATGGNAAKVAGAKAIMRISGMVRTTTAVDNTLYVRVTDNTAGTTPFIRTGTGTGDTTGYFVPAGTAGINTNWWPLPAIEFEIPFPTAGSRTFTLAVAQSAGVIMRVRDVTISFVGTVS